MVLNKELLIEKLGLEPHQEGGYFKQLYKCEYNIAGDKIDSRDGKDRSLATSIYFLLSDSDVSHFHRLKADEIWYFHGGESLEVAMIDEDGEYSSITLGLDIENGELPQYTVKAGTIFGSYVKSGKGTSLVGCMVSYGFEFEDFELFERKDLLEMYPKHKNIIEKLTF